MKPDAPAEIRGEFKPIATTVPGVQLCEQLPRLARQMHRCTLIRSAHHSVNNAHAAAVYCRPDRPRPRRDRRRDAARRPPGHRLRRRHAPAAADARRRPTCRCRTSPRKGPAARRSRASSAAARPRPRPAVRPARPQRPRLRHARTGPAGRRERRPSRRPQAPPRRDRRRRRTATPRPASCAGFQARRFDLLTSPAAQKAFQLEHEPDGCARATAATSTARACCWPGG